MKKGGKERQIRSSSSFIFPITFVHSVMQSTRFPLWLDRVFFNCTVSRNEVWLSFPRDVATANKRNHSVPIVPIVQFDTTQTQSHATNIKKTLAKLLHEVIAFQLLTPGSEKFAYTLWFYTDYQRFVLSLRASSLIWASEANRERTRERAAKPRGTTFFGVENPKEEISNFLFKNSSRHLGSLRATSPPLRFSRLLSRASGACTFHVHDVPQMESVLAGLFVLCCSVQASSPWWYTT